MKSQVQLILITLALLLLPVGNALADTCYDPNYGYFECDQGYYYYPDSSQAFYEGAFIGAVIGGLYNNNDYYNNNWHGGRGNWGGGHGGNWGGGHGGGGGWHGGGGGGGHHR